MPEAQICDLAVIGGGPAGFFAAVRYASLQPDAKIIVLEKTQRVLQKVLVSGGGRCNITHDCNDPGELILSYPRGGKSLLSGFYTFKPQDTLNWFRARGLDFYTDEEGCVFPITDQSQSVIDILAAEAEQLGVRVWTEAGVESVELLDSGQFFLHLTHENKLITKRVLVATGGNRQGLKLLSKMDVPIVEPVPALFPFKLKEDWLQEYAGLTVDPCRVSVPCTDYQAEGTLLITHRGISGPAVIRLSSWAARHLKEKSYLSSIEIDWIPDVGNVEKSLQILKTWKADHASKRVLQKAVFPIFAARLWEGLCRQVPGFADKRWGDVSKKDLMSVNNVLRKLRVNMIARDQHKQEFVTCGGVDLHSVDLRTMESKLVPDLFFAGEVLDIDGLTGGYNLQNCWTTGWLAGTAMAQKEV